VQEAERYKAKDEANRARVEAKHALENYVFQIKNSINNEKLADKVFAEDKNTVTDAINATAHWLNSNQAAEKEEFEEKQKALEAIVQPVLQDLLEEKYALAGSTTVHAQEKMALDMEID
jgi:L1 cell adhesion molecule like protein